MENKMTSRKTELIAFIHSLRGFSMAFLATKSEEELERKVLRMELMAKYADEETWARYQALRR